MYEIALRDPFHDMRRLMRRQFGPSFAGGPPGGALSRRPRDRFSERRFRRPALPLDVTETDAGLTIEAGLPGFTLDDVTVGVEGHTLTISAVKHSVDAAVDANVEEPAADEVESGAVDSAAATYVIRERSTQGLERSVRIGRAYDPDTVAASLKDGLLTVTIGKTAAAQSRTVEISAS